MGHWVLVGHQGLVAYLVLVGCQGLVVQWVLVGCRVQGVWWVVAGFRVQVGHQVAAVQRALQAPLVQVALVGTAAELQARDT